MPKLLLPSTLGRLAIKGWQFPPHIQAMQRAAMNLLYDPSHNRLIVEIPVRHGKSFYYSYLFPAWNMIARPDKSAWVVSYGSEFSTEWSSKVRDLVAAYGPALTGVSLDANFKPRSHFRLERPHTGELRGLGIGGALAGKGAHLIIGDDLVKEFSEVATEEARDKLFRLFHGELLNRLEPGGKMILVMSRRHPEDLSGRLMAENPNLADDQQWRRITFKAITDDGKALWPERYPLEKLLAIKRDYELAGMEWIWHSLYQQDPATAAELCEWPSSYWKNLYYQDLPQFTPRFRLMSLDPSMGKDRHKGDYAALLYAEVDRFGCLWVEDPALVRVPVTQLEALAAAMVRQRSPHAFAIETNNFQSVVAQNVHQKVPGAPIYAYDSTENKQVRIRMGLTPLLAQQKLRIKDTPQGRILGAQLRDFPLGTHDDGPDALALMVRLWRDLLGSGRATPEGGRIYTA